MMAGRSSVQIFTRDSDDPSLLALTHISKQDHGLPLFLALIPLLLPIPDFSRMHRNSNGEQVTAQGNRVTPRHGHDKDQRFEGMDRPAEDPRPHRIGGSPHWPTKGRTIWSEREGRRGDLVTWAPDTLSF